MTGIVHVDRYIVVHPRWYDPDGTFDPVKRENAMSFNIYVVQRGGPASDSWAVVDERNRCYSVENGWEWEPRPSERDDEFIKRARFPLSTALTLAEAAVMTLKINGRTGEEWWQELYGEL